MNAAAPTHTEDNTMDNRIARADIMARRLAWGARQVGIARTLNGLARLAALRLRRPVQGRIRTCAGGLDIFFNYPSQLMPMLVVFQDLLEPELAMVASCLGPGRVAIDVGASIGTWTLCAARTGALVHACEPDPENFASLGQNLARNGLESGVRLYRQALGSGEGWGVNAPEDRLYLNQVRLADGIVAGGAGTRVQTLEGFVRDLGLDSVDLLKVNTTGCEREVLAGGMELFRQRRIGLAMFLDGLAVRPLLDELRAFSYTLGVHDGRRFIPVASSHDLDRVRPGPMSRYVVVQRDATRAAR